MKKLAALGGLFVFAAIPVHALEPSVSIYGSVGASVGHFDADDGSDTFMNSNASHVGLWVSGEYGGALGFFRYERGFDRYHPDSSNGESADFLRSFYAGVQSGFGTLSFGRMRSEYARAGESVDPFFNTSVSGFNGRFSNEGANYGLSNLTNGFSDRVLSWSSNDYSGLRVNAAVFFGNGERDDFGLGAAYHGVTASGDHFEVGVQALEIRNPQASAIPFNAAASVGGSPGESTNVRLYGSYYSPYRFGVSFSAESVDVSAESSARIYASLSGTYYLQNHLRLAAAVGFLDFPAGGPPIEGIGYSLGAFYDVSQNLSLYAAGRYVDYDNLGPGPTADTTSLAVGVNYGFDINLW